MNCAQARPLLLAGDPAADTHLEGCAACGAWLEKHDPLVNLIRAARPEALPAPARLRYNRNSWRLRRAHEAWDRLWYYAHGRGRRGSWELSHPSV